MFGVELVEPRIEPGHALATVELVDDRLPCERGDVQTGISGTLVELIRKADVPSRHTHIIHTQGA
jgi:hypothetical protein